MEEVLEIVKFFVDVEGMEVTVSGSIKMLTALWYCFAAGYFAWGYFLGDFRELKTLDPILQEFLEILKILAKEEGMEKTAFGTYKGITILLSCVLVGVEFVQPLGWGIFLGLIIGGTAASLICWDKKSIVEVIANMPLERQISLAKHIVKTVFALSKIPPKILAQSAVLYSRDDGDIAKSRVANPSYDGQTVTLSEGKVASREQVVLALREYLAKEMGMSITK